MQIAFVGDIHIGNQVSSRVDDYFETCLYKLEQVFKNNNTTIFLGDIFNTPTMDLFKIQQVYNLFTRYNNVKKYTIIGNHDVYNMNTNTLAKTTLGLFETLGSLTIIREEPIEIAEGIKVCSMPLRYDDIKPNSDIDENTIMLGHHFFNLSVPDSISADKLVEYYPNVRIYFFGHDHQSYEPYNDGCITVLRPGSLLRNAATPYNFEKIVGYYQLDTEKETTRFVPILCKDAKEIFEADAFERKEYKSRIYLENLEKIIDSYSERIKNSNRNDYSLLKVLDELNTPDECKKYITSIHVSAGISMV